MKKNPKEVQEGHEKEAQEPSTQDEQALAATIDATSSKENTALPKLVIHLTVPMIPVVNTKRKKGKNSRELKRPRKVLTVLANKQLQSDRQCDVHLINPPANPSEHFTHNVPHPK